ncbi:nickel-dependent lactate racemase [Dethiosulfatarculus sandiegensis]|uniref:Uncharacterized protein n=1 Tax=Dethiosulfatarculus sandiegensis TaxID=1429043 RepID=A0A0D2K1U1_9BACT|nr:nickel-dependent lactate racemase [Dethiosulfatarculus sandiegensis]KIX15650.1 hypothetical protein X474_03180 [Dethiosulfatarculus sandiegensis]
MANKEFTLRYGKGDVSFEIPEENLLYELVGNNIEPPADLAQVYKDSLENPIDSPPLSQIVKPGETVAITVSDITRQWQRHGETLPILLNALNSYGVPDENITIIIAVGAHRGNTESEFVELCGQEACDRVKVVNHNAWDTDNMVYLGTTSRGTEVSVNRIIAEADRVILTGGVIYHYMVGYGGGRKSIMPGISSLKTIQQSHTWALNSVVGKGSNPICANKITRGNPAHDDMMDVASFVNPDFIINVVPNLDGDVCGIFAGNWVSAWRDACDLVDKIFGVEIEAQADIVISTAGGYPKDINLYQTQKTIDNAVYAMKPGGVCVILAECPDISEPGEFFDWFNIEDFVEMEKAVRANYLISGWVAVRQREYANQGTILMLTLKENNELAKKACVEPVNTIEEALKAAHEACGVDNPKVIVMPQGANTFPIFTKKED